VFCRQSLFSSDRIFFETLVLRKRNHLATIHDLRNEYQWCQKQPWMMDRPSIMILWSRIYPGNILCNAKGRPLTEVTCDRRETGSVTGCPIPAIENIRHRKHPNPDRASKPLVLKTYLNKQPIIHSSESIQPKNIPTLITHRMVLSKTNSKVEPLIHCGTSIQPNTIQTPITTTTVLVQKQDVVSIGILNLKKELSSR